MQHNRPEDWVRKHESDSGLRDGVTREQRERIKALRRANETPKLASAFFAQAALDRQLES